MSKSPDLIFYAEDESERILQKESTFKRYLIFVKF